LIIDFHSHILPGIDDGSKSVKMSETMLMQSKEQGIEVQVLTPHFYPDTMQPEQFLMARRRSYEALKPVADKIGIRLVVGAEVALFRTITDWDCLKEFCLSGTNLLLIEMPFCQWTDKDIEVVAELEHCGVRPVIAHLERFLEFQKDKTQLKELLDMGLIYQINVGPLLKFSKRGQTIKLLKTAGDVILGSDCHNTTTRIQNMKEGRDMIEKRLGRKYLAQVDEFAASLLE